MQDWVKHILGLVLFIGIFVIFIGIMTTVKRDEAYVPSPMDQEYPSALTYRKMIWSPYSSPPDLKHYRDYDSLGLYKKKSW